MRDWRNSGMRPFIDKKKGCKRCLTVSGLKKIRDAFSRTTNRLRELWSGRKNNNQND